MKASRDLEVRGALADWVAACFSGDADTLTVHELGLCLGASRIDLAVVNGDLHGYEIKSESDNLARLPRQAEIYSKIFDYVTVVVGPSHVKAVSQAIPDWWGIIKAEPDDPVRLFEIRHPWKNQDPNAFDIAQLLWRSEVIEILREMGLDDQQRGKTRDVLHRLLSQSLPLVQLQHHVRQRLRARRDWRSGPTPFRCGDLSRSSARSRHSPENRRWLLSVGSRDRQR
jgi:hypothetical protein